MLGSRCRARSVHKLVLRETAYAQHTAPSRHQLVPELKSQPAALLASSAVTVPDTSNPGMYGKPSGGFLTQSASPAGLGSGYQKTFEKLSRPGRRRLQTPGPIPVINGSRRSAQMLSGMGLGWGCAPSRRYSPGSGRRSGREGGASQTSDSVRVHTPPTSGTFPLRHGWHLRPPDTFYSRIQALSRKPHSKSQSKHFRSCWVAADNHSSPNAALLRRDVQRSAFFIVMHAETCTDA